MLLTIDVGNSDIVTVLYNENKEILKYNRQATIKQESLSAYENYVNSIKNEFNIKDCDYIVSCVVPSIEKTLKTALVTNLKGRAHFVNYQSYLDISKLLDPPSEIGADLIAESVEVIKTYKQPAIIVDMGTATKIIVVNNDTIEGVAILLGVKKTRDAIVNSIPHLPSVELVLPKNIVGQNTNDSIQSGIMFGAIASINGYTKIIEKHFGQKVSKVITGGMSRLFINDLSEYKHSENLVNDGLYTIFDLLKTSGEI